MLLYSVFLIYAFTSNLSSRHLNYLELDPSDSWKYKMMSTVAVWPMCATSDLWNASLLRIPWTFPIIILSYLHTRGWRYLTGVRSVVVQLKISQPLQHIFLPSAPAWWWCLLYVWHQLKARWDAGCVSCPTGPQCETLCRTGYGCNDPDWQAAAHWECVPYSQHYR